MNKTKKSLYIATIVFGLLLIMTITFIVVIWCMDSPQDGSLPSPDQIQHLINKMLPSGYRIAEDGNIGQQTKQAWTYALTPEENRKFKDWGEFLETIRIPEMEIK